MNSTNSCPYYEGENAEELLHFGYKPIQVKKAVQLGTVVTLPASGSEMNYSAVITHNKAKYVFK